MGGKSKLMGAVALGSTYEDLKVLTTGMWLCSSTQLSAVQ